MQLFYDPEFSQNHHFLNAEESYHAIKVLRKNTGDKIFITDGNGTIFQAEIIIANPKKCDLQILKKEEISAPHGYFHLAIAPTKNNDRMEWLVEKCTEIGLQEITFFYAQHSERSKFKTERMLKKAIAAMKQSLSAYLPQINAPVNFNQVITMEAEQKVIAHYNGSNQNLQSIIQTGKSCLVLIGPEGDFSENEIEQAKQQGFKPVNLGSRRLRTETAGLAACHTYALLHQ